MEKQLILIPTYNERENVSALIPELRNKFPELDILVVDDSSPDGTSEVIRNFSNSDTRVNLLLRENKEGLGKALFSGYKYAVENGYQKIIQMDADFSHPTEYIKDILDHLDSNTVVICSRYVRGGGSCNWPLPRIFLSWLANFLTSILLTLSIKDATTGYRGFPSSFLKEFISETPIASGYLIQVETVLKSLRLGYHIKEVPFIYQRRRGGESKLDICEAFKSGWGLLRLRFKRYN
ncbi:MAG: polyprenol monophosphomannose synthase [Candidatus Saelkia tenebricola]|nr:polyprenol monophosphomannose synthase [Candidatus Saelkia tenebricola]